MPFPTLGNFFTAQGAQAPSASTQPDQCFTRVAESGRIIRAYSGVLPCTRRVARHLLRCEHLRELPGEGLLPYRAEPHFTHQLWLWYRLNQEPEALQLLFQGQFDFTLPGKNPDWVAGEVADFLAYLLLQPDNRPQSVLRHPQAELYWALAVERKVVSLAKKARSR